MDRVYIQIEMYLNTILLIYRTILNSKYYKALSIRNVRHWQWDLARDLKATISSHPFVWALIRQWITLPAITQWRCSQLLCSGMVLVLFCCEKHGGFFQERYIFIRALRVCISMCWWVFFSLSFDLIWLDY